MLLVYAAPDEPIAMAVADLLPLAQFEFVPIERLQNELDLAMRDATDVVLLWSASCARNKDLPYVMNTAVLLRMQRGGTAVWVFRLDSARPPLNLAEFSRGGGLANPKYIAAKLTGPPPIPPTNPGFFGRTDLIAKFDQVYYSDKRGFLWLTGLSGIGKRTLARRQAKTYDPSGHSTQHIPVQSGMQFVELDMRLVANLRSQSLEFANEIPVAPDAGPDAARESLTMRIKDASRSSAIWVVEDAQHWLSDDAEPDTVLERLIDSLVAVGITSYKAIAIVTSTRLPKLRADIQAKTEVVRVGPLAVEDGVRLLMERGAVRVEQGRLRQCARELGGHPLALQIAARSIAEGRGDWSEGRVRAATQVLSATRMQESTRQVLEVLAVVDGPLPPRDVAEHLGMGHEEFEAAVNEATSYSLCEVADDGFARLHPLVRDYFLDYFRQHRTQEAMSDLASRSLRFLDSLPRPYTAVFVDAAFSAFRLLGLAMRLRDAMELRRNLVGPIYAAGVELYREGRWEEALRCFETVLDWRGDDEGAQLYLARCYARVDRLEEAREMIERLLADKPGDRQALRVAGRIEYIARNWHAAMEYYRRAVDWSRPYGPAVQDFAQALLRLGRTPEAEENLRAVIKSGEADAFTFGFMSEALVAHGNLSGALEFASLARQYEPTNAQFTERYAELLRSSGQVEVAARELEQALHLNRNNDSIRVSLASVLVELGEPYRAASLLQGIRTDRTRSSWRYLLTQAQIARAQGRSRDSIQAALSALSVAAGNRAALSGVAEVLLGAGAAELPAADLSEHLASVVSELRAVGAHDEARLIEAQSPH
jgi:tetratricopeptide (TPR) repeat protein